MRHKTEKMKLSEHGVIPEEALLAYVNNELTAEEKQELEKLLKDDPFAQEAIEGLQQANKLNLVASVVNINKRVRERTGLKESKTIKLHWSNYAWAAVVFGILIGIGFLMVNYMGKHETSIAMNKKAEEESVNLMEKKLEGPNLITREANPITDSISVSPNQEVAAKGNTALENNPVEVKQNAGNSVTTRNDAQEDHKTTIAKQQAVTATGGGITPHQAANNTTILADDRGISPAAKPVSANQAASSGDKGKEESNISGVDSRPEKLKTTAVPQSARKSEDDLSSTESVVRGAIVEKEPANKVALITMDDAMKRFNSGDYKASSEQFSEILKQQPDNIDALYFGAISDYINGNTKKSEKSFDRLLKEGTRYSDGSRWYKANILLKKGKRDEAKKLLDELANSGGSYKERAVKKKAEMEF